MIKVVFDTNILISGLFWRGLPRRIIDLAISNRITSLTSAEILQETEDVLLENFKDISHKKIEDIIRDILSYSQLVATQEVSVQELRDIKDTKIISCAVSAKAHYIVTGDKDLLIVREYKGIKILSAREFWDMMK